MKQSRTRLVEGWTLVVVLALVALAARSLLAGVGNSPELNATVTPVTPLPATPSRTATLAPSPTPSLTSLPTATSTPSKTPTSTPTHTPTPPAPTATSTYTPTPLPAPVSRGAPATLTFLPGTPSPTPVVVTRTNSITLTVTLTAPTPMPLVEQPDNVINILLLGSDLDGIDKVGRTDTIVVATIHPELPAVSLLSIPRDFYAWMPGQGFGKINTAFSRGGPVLMEATIRHNFGIEIDYYARVGFDSFVRIVDALGGVDVAVECPLRDTFPDPSSPSGQTDVDWEPGIHHLDGKHALWYARSRWSTSDFDRHRRQQQVLRGLYRQVMSLGIIPKIPSLWSALRENVSTDLDLPGLIRLGAIGMRLDTANVKSRFVGGGAVTSWEDPKGLYILIPDGEALSSLVSDALAPLAYTPQQVGRVAVVYATPHEG
ncbi:MAG: LCP family protein, partial [Anaerolineae bacterium]